MNSLNQKDPFKEIVKTKLGRLGKYNSLVSGILGLIPQEMLGIIRARELMNNSTSKGLNGVPFVKDIMDQLNIQVTGEGIENIPEEGVPAVLIGPHHKGFEDFIIPAMYIAQKRQDIMVVTIPEAKAFGGFAENIISISDPDHKEKMNAHTKNGGLLIIFPGGEIANRDEKTGIVKDIPWEKKGFLHSAIGAGAEIITMVHNGQNPEKFHDARDYGNQYGKGYGSVVPVPGYGNRYGVVLSSLIGQAGLILATLASENSKYHVAIGEGVKTEGKSIDDPSLTPRKFWEDAYELFDKHFSS